jgi:hypothetical protein
MKKTLSLLIAGLALSVFMIGCSKPDEGDNAAVPVTSGNKSDTAEPDSGPPSSAPGSTTGAAPDATTGK